MKSKQWLLALGIATTMTVSGIAMAATVTEKGEGKADFKSRQETHQKGEFRGGMKEFRQTHTKLLELLKIDAQTFKTEMKAGKTLLVIANEHGVSAEDLKGFLTGQMTNQIDKRVADGRLSVEKAADMRANMSDRVNDMMNGKKPEHRAGDKRDPGSRGNAKLLELLKIDRTTLRAELQAGKTLGTIAQEHGVSEQELRTGLTARMTERIDEGVKSGRISAEQGADRKAHIAERVNDMINGKMPAHRDFPGHGKKQKAQ